jgi:hypothetical protein
LELLQIHEGTGIELLHRYFKPTKGLGHSKINILPVPSSGSIVRWAYTGLSTYPMNLLTSILNMDKIIGTDLENCLSRLNEAPVSEDKKR